MSPHPSTIRAAVQRVDAALQAAESYPPGASAEILRVIRDAAEDDAHVERAASHLIRTQRWRPVAAEWSAALTATAEAGPDPAGEPSTALGCESCDYTGWVISTGAWYSGAKPCRCRTEGRMRPRPEMQPITTAGLAEQRRMLREIAQERNLSGVGR